MDNLQKKIQSVLQLFNQRQFNKAEELTKKLILENSKESFLFNILGICMASQDKTQESIKQFKEAINLKPDFFEAHFNLGNALTNLGEPNKAIICYKEAIKIKPDYSDAFNNLANVLIELEKTKEAIQYLNQAIKIKPDLAMAYYNLGRCYKKLNQNEEAIKNYKESIKIQPNLAMSYNNIGVIFKSIGKIEEAIRYYKKASELKPDFSEAFNNLGGTLMGLGKFDDAINYINKAISINPNLMEAHRHLSLIIKYNINHPHLNLMKKEINKKNITDEQKIHLSFAIGKALEDSHDYKNAFKHLYNANKLKRRSINYSIDDEKKNNLALQKIFSKKLFDKLKRKDYGYKEKVPIFIVGMPRSGSTLVEQILSSHSKVFGTGEVEILDHLIKKYFNIQKEIIFQEDPFNIDKSLFNKIGEEYIITIKKFSNLAEKITDKNLLNFRWIGLIKIILPNAKIIHCERNPKDNCLSIFKNFFARNTVDYSYDLVELAEYFNLYSNLMKHWNILLPDFIYNISYDKLINGQKFETEKLLNFCNLKWEDDCLNFHKNKRFIGTASVTQSRQPIYKHSLESWKRYKNELKPLIETLKI